MNTFAAVLKALDVGRGDRVVIYMPNMAEAVFAMLACARIGAVHSVVFGGFAAHNLALRIDDATPKLLICADAGMRGGKVIAYKPLVDAACDEAQSPPPQVLVVSRGLDPGLHDRRKGATSTTPRCARSTTATQVDVEWLESNEPSYLLYTSGTTGKPKGVQRDVGGYAVALALSMWSIYDVRAGQVMFSTSDVGWAVGHSYNVYGPLIAGATSVLYEGLPTNPDPGDLVAHLRAVRRAHDVLLADRHPRAEETGSVVADASTTCRSCSGCSSPASRSTNPPRTGSPTASARPSSTTTGRPKPAGRCCR